MRSDFSLNNNNAFTGASRGLREAFAERVFEKASRSLQGTSTEVYEPFAEVA